MNLRYLILTRFSIPSFKFSIRQSISSLELKGERLTLIEQSASKSESPKPRRARLIFLVAEFDEQADPLETYIPLEER